MSTIALGFQIVWWLLPVLGFQDVSAVPPHGQAPPRISETQLTLRLGRVQGQATVIANEAETLTVLTAAHFLAPEDVGKSILILEKEAPLTGKVVNVTRNPNFHLLRSRDTNRVSARGTLGVDTEIAALKLELHNESERRVYEKIQAADLTAVPIPVGSKQIVSVHIQDQFGKEHVVRAGNHLNPKCLAWGRRYFDAQRGDSGSGVFVMEQTADGEPWPVLIGNISQIDDRGGIASLAYRKDPWIEKALEGLPPRPLKAGTDRPPAGSDPPGRQP